MPVGCGFAGDIGVGGRESLHRGGIATTTTNTRSHRRRAIDYEGISRLLRRPLTKSFAEDFFNETGVV